MHNCRATRKRLIELALDQAPSSQSEPLLDELERCRTELKFCGAMINGHTNGQYLDDPALLWSSIDD